MMHEKETNKEEREKNMGARATCVLVRRGFIGKLRLRFSPSENWQKAHMGSRKEEKKVG